MKFVAVLLSLFVGLFFAVTVVSAQSNVVAPAPGDVIVVPPADGVIPPPEPPREPLPPKPLPEPSTLMLLGVALAAGAGYTILKRKKG